MQLGKFVALCFLTLVGGALIGFIKDDLDPNVRIAQLRAKFDSEETACLREALYYEGRGGLKGEQIMQGMVILARVKDPDPQWPKTICGVVHQNNQFSYWNDEKVMSQRIDAVAWGHADETARYLREKAWTWQLLPRGWECVRSFKVRDEKLLTLSEKALAQLHLKQRGVGFFRKTQQLVSTIGESGFYQSKARCKNPLQTT